MMKCKNKPSYGGLSLILTSIVFIIIFSTMCIIGLIISFLYNNNLFSPIDGPKPLYILIFIAILSIIIGSVLTFIFSKIPLKPINKLITATKELSNGNFDIRINFDHPKELKELSNSFNNMANSKIPLKPINKLITATKELSNGNFDIRINFDHPKELKELSNSFNNMAKELGSVELLRNDFVNNFSHEFKTPIVSLRGFAKLLKNDNLTKEERDEYLDIIISESDRLALLATNILNLSNIENKTINTSKSNFDLSEQIRHSILLLESKWSSKNIEINIDLDETKYIGNEELLKQVWVNLIENAIKFTNKEGKIDIQLMSFEDSKVFKIRDTGIGMSQKTKKHIFDKFYQGDTSHTIEGNGLGLTMVKKIIDLHNGIVEVKSQLNKGTIITVTLPLD